MIRCSRRQRCIQCGYSAYRSPVQITSILIQPLPNHRICKNHPSRGIYNQHPFAESIESHSHAVGDDRLRVEILKHAAQVEREQYEPTNAQCQNEQRFWLSQPLP